MKLEASTLVEEFNLRSLRTVLLLDASMEVCLMKIFLMSSIVRASYFVSIEKGIRVPP